MNITKFTFRFICLILLVLLTASCDYIPYRLHSRKQNFKERPSILICERIVDFRIAEGGWPTSKIDFMSKGVKYYEVLKNFPYENTEFKIKDSTEMTFYYYGHKADNERMQKTNKIDLNVYHGSIRFWKENGKFLWKVYMK